MNHLGVLLAGGLSRRMGGGDKSLIRLGDKPVLAHALSNLQAQTRHVVINANGDPNRFAPFAVPIVPDTMDGFAGPLAGVLSGMRYAEQMPEPPLFIMTAAADTPFFPHNLASQLIAASGNGTKIVLASSNKQRHPTFGLWPIALANHLEAWLADPDNRKVLVWVDQHSWAGVDFPLRSIDKTLFDPFFNINTPDDLAQAQSLLEKMKK